MLLPARGRRAPSVEISLYRESGERMSLIIGFVRRVSTSLANDAIIEAGSRRVVRVKRDSLRRNRSEAREGEARASFSPLRGARGKLERSARALSIRLRFLGLARREPGAKAERAGIVRFAVKQLIITCHWRHRNCAAFPARRHGESAPHGEEVYDRKSRRGSPRNLSSSL